MAVSRVPDPKGKNGAVIGRGPSVTECISLTVIVQSVPTKTAIKELINSVMILGTRLA